MKQVELTLPLIEMVNSPDRSLTTFVMPQFRNLFTYSDVEIIVPEDDFPPYVTYWDVVMLKTIGALKKGTICLLCNVHIDEEELCFMKNENGKTIQWDFNFGHLHTSRIKKNTSKKIKLPVLSDDDDFSGPNK